MIREALRELRRGTRPRVARVPGGTVLVGVDIGRTRVTYGLLRVRVGRPLAPWLPEALSLLAGGLFALALGFVPEMSTSPERVEAVGSSSALALALACLGGAVVSRRRLETHGRSSLPQPAAVDARWARSRLWSGERAEVYDELERAIREACDYAVENGKRVDGIGLSVPGQVDPSSGVVRESGGFLAKDAEISKVLSQRLAGDDAIARAFGTRGRLRPDDFRRRLLIDNDARCATRYVFTSQSSWRAEEHAAWRNFACIVIGSGVGGGFVFHRELYYGSGASAGEAGHTTVDLETVLNGRSGISRRGLRRLLAFRSAEEDELRQECGCGGRGAHWESLVGGKGLERLARAVDPKIYRQLVAAFHADAGGSNADRCGCCGSRDGHELSAPLLVKAAAAADGHDPPRTVSRRVREELAKPKTCRYLEQVIASYSQLLAIGVANIVNTLNIDRIALGGGVMNHLRRLTRFTMTFEAELQRYVMPTAMKNLDHVLFEDLGPSSDESEQARNRWAWQGAALLFWDASYMALASE